MAAIVPINYFNSFWIKKVGFAQSGNNDNKYINTWPGIFYDPVGYSNFPINAATTDAVVNGRNYYIEEARIRGGYNNTSVSFGVKAYIDEEIIDQQHRFNTIIYSGVYNSLTGFNATNVFSVGESITKSVDPSNGSIQKLYQSDSNLNILQENKVSYALVDKDALYTAEGTASLTSTNLVIGQVIPYLGKFGISKNPESFAYYGLRKYFSDVYRGSVLRLSRDGITEISNYGMKDYFRDASDEYSDEVKFFEVSLQVDQSVSSNSFTVLDPDKELKYVEEGSRIILNNVSTNIFVAEVNVSSLEIKTDVDIDVSFEELVVFTRPVKDKVIGGWDNHNRLYTLSYQKALTSPSNTVNFTVDFGDTNSVGNTNTVTFDDDIKGWNSFYTYRPNQIFSLQGEYYSANGGKIWKHYQNTSDNNNHGVFYNTHYSSSVIFNINDSPSIKKVFQTVNYEGDNGFEISYFKSDFQKVDADLPLASPPTYAANNEYQDTTPLIHSYDQGLYTDAITGQPKRAGFNRKENLYVANLINNSTVRPGEIIFGNNISGIKGYFATVKISTDNYTDIGGLKELWSVGTKFVQSS